MNKKMAWKLPKQMDLIKKEEHQTKIKMTKKMKLPEQMEEHRKKIKISKKLKWKLLTQMELMKKWRTADEDEDELNVDNNE